MKELKYLPQWLRICLATFASLFILFYGRPLDIIGSFGMPEFYPIFIFSTIIAFIMVETVHQFTMLLDKRDPWTNQWPERAVLQFTLGFLVPLGFDLFVFTVYFQFLDQEITKNGFFWTDFPFIVCFILLLNCYYVLHFFIDYALSKDEILILESNTLEVAGVDSSDLMRIENNGILVNLSLTTDVFYFYRDKKNVKVKTSKGNDYAVPYSLAQIVECYSEIGFCQINRGTIINLKIIKGYILGSKRDTLELLVKADFDAYLANFEDRLVVTKDNIDDFKRQFGV